MTEKILNIVIVEDDELDYELLSRALQKSGIAYVEKWFKNGEEVLRFMESGESGHSSEFSKNVFFLDINLPKIDGLKVVENIKNHADRKKDMVIMLSGSSQKSDMETSKKNGSDLYIVKPFGKQQIDEFNDSIRSILSSIV